MPANPDEPEVQRGDASPHAGQAEQPEQDEAPSPTPFDHPLFLPALLLAFSLWFGYDGFLNDDPDMLEHRTFNRVGFAIWVVLLAYYGYRGWREFSEPDDPADPPS